MPSPSRSRTIGSDRRCRRNADISSTKLDMLQPRSCSAPKNHSPASPPPIAPIIPPNMAPSNAAAGPPNVPPQMAPVIPAVTVAANAPPNARPMRPPSKSSALAKSPLDIASANACCVCHASNVIAAAPTNSPAARSILPRSQVGRSLQCVLGRLGRFINPFSSNGMLLNISVPPNSAILTFLTASRALFEKSLPL